MTFTIGETVGPYRITDRLGQGGMATVFKAYHAKLDRNVAIKVLHPAFKEDENFVGRFQREAQIVAKLEHPNIVPIYDAAEQDGQPYLVMKFIEGETLKARLSKGALPLTDTLDIMTAVGAALTYAHQQGILHRDIKPSNILLESETHTAYLADFGLARMAGAGESTLSQDVMLGTPHYISPEQAQGVRDLDAGTDIYSLGVVLYEILVGRVPFSADTPYAIVHDHIFAPLPLPSKVNPAVPPAVEKVLLRALAKDRQDRYASAVEMVDALRQAVTDSNIKELNGGSYRVPLPADDRVTAGSTALEPPTPSVAQTLPPIAGAGPVPATTPPPIPTAPLAAVEVAGVTQILPESSIGSISTLRRQKERRRQRNNLWIFTGFAGLVMTCLCGAIVTVSAFADPAIQSSLLAPRPSVRAPPAAQTAAIAQRTKIAAVPTETQDPTPTTAGLATEATTGDAAAIPEATSGPEFQSQFTPDAKFAIPELSLTDAQDRVNLDADNALNQYALGLALAKERGRLGQQLRAQQAVLKALELDPNNEPLIFSAAHAFSNTRVVSGLYAIGLYGKVLSMADAPKDDRDEAGQWLYRRANAVKNVLEVPMFHVLMEQFPKLAESYALAGLATLRTGQEAEAGELLKQAEQRAPSSPYIKLIRGILDQFQKKLIEARQDWEEARGLPDAPQWLVKEVEQLLKGL